MSRPAISVENLSKVYRIGVKDHAPDTLASAVTGFVRAPLRNLQRLRQLSRFRSDEDSPDALWALKDVSFEVQEGEVLGVIGRNGAGKSTLLKILSRITEPTSGRAVIRGRVSSLLEVGTGFHPELTGRDNIYMNGTILGMTKREIDRKFDEIVDFSGVERFLDTPIKRYSSGMNVRLAFSVAAHLEPEILIIDEVLAVGDMEFQRKCLGKMNEVSRSGRTVLFVSHNMGAVLSLCRQGLLLESGQVKDYGAVDAVASKYGQPAQHQSGSFADLWDHPRRPAGRIPVFRAIQLLNSRGVPIDQFACGDGMTIDVALDCDRMIERVNIRLGFEDHMGLLLFEVATHLSAHGPICINGPSRLQCKLYELPLPPGSYSVSLHAGWERKSMDEVHQAIRFEVAPADFYHTGRIAKSFRGRILARSTWNLFPAPRT